MRKFLFFLITLLQFNSYAQEAVSNPVVDSLKEIQIKSTHFLESSESCQDILTNHMSIVDDSENFIGTLANKKSEEISQYEISMLQKILTNRFIHLQKTLDAYTDKEEVKGCSPAALGDAIAIYDLTLLGGKALNDSTLRRIVYNFTKYPKYKLTELRKMYSHYTSQTFIEEFQERLNADKIALPEHLTINRDIKDGYFTRASDVAIRGTSSIISGAARVWGFISDRLKWRDGYLNGNIEVLNSIKANLKPLDLIYEKRNFTLSNYTIPGHWGHVAVWLGTKEELIQLGVWDKDYFEPFRQAVEEGKNIIEIRKKGMNFVSLEDFVNLDEIAVMRITNAIEKREEIFSNISDEMDATYDFAFNAQTPDKLTCSEMIAYSYGDIHWPEMKTLIEVSLRPDDIAVLSIYKNSPEEFVLYFKGKQDKSAEQMSFEEWRGLFKEKTENGELVYQ